MAVRRQEAWKVERIAALAVLLLSLLHARPACAEDTPLVDWIRRTARPFETCQPRDDHRDLASGRFVADSPRKAAV